MAANIVEREKHVKRAFDRDIAEHKVVVLHDDGLYRHLRCGRPNTIMYSFNIVTWPGYLAAVGDMGDYVFSRIPDMFDFFGDGTKYEGEINPYYWAQKLQGTGHSRDMSRVFSLDAFEERVKQWAAGVIDYYDPNAVERDRFKLAVKTELLDCKPLSGHEAHDLLRRFEVDGISISDSWEWDIEEFRYDYLWCCYAIVWAIAKYQAGETSGQTQAA